LEVYFQIVKTQIHFDEALRNTKSSTSNFTEEGALSIVSSTYN